MEQQAPAAVPGGNGRILTRNSTRLGLPCHPENTGIEWGSYNFMLSSPLPMSRVKVQALHDRVAAVSSLAGDRPAWWKSRMQPSTIKRRNGIIKSLFLPSLCMGKTRF